MSGQPPSDAGIAICAALRWELRPVLRALQRVRLLRASRPRTWQGVGSAGPILVFQTGIGMDRAAEATRSIIKELSPAAIVNTGCAGALCPTLVAGDVVCASALVGGEHPDLHRYATSSALTSALCQAGVSAGFRPVTRAILTTREPLLTRAHKADAFASSAAVAVEMEGAAIAQAALEAGVEVASVRVILDDATNSPPVSGGEGKTTFDFARNVASATLSVEEVTRFSVTGGNAPVVDGVLGKLFKSFLRSNV